MRVTLYLLKHKETLLDTLNADSITARAARGVPCI